MCITSIESRTNPTSKIRPSDPAVNELVAAFSLKAYKSMFCVSGSAFLADYACQRQFLKTHRRQNHKIDSPHFRTGGRGRPMSLVPSQHSEEPCRIDRLPLATQNCYCVAVPHYDIYYDVDNIQFSELVFAFVYAVGTDADPVASVLENYLKLYKYQTETFRVSNHLRSLDLGISFDSSSPFEKMEALMNAGNAARRQSRSDDILAAMAVTEISAGRTEDEAGRTKPRERVAHVIRSLKRPEEVRLLRDVYRPGFFLIAIADDEDSQFNHLIEEKGLAKNEAHSVVERDQEEHTPHGQRTRNTFYLADVFVERREERYKHQLSRFLELVFGHPFHTPSREEHAMFLAYASAARSAQLGRQVGAAIATPDGEVVAVGMNEVPCRRGGPYWEADPDDKRDHLTETDSNVQFKQNIVNSIVKQLTNTQGVKLLSGDTARERDVSAAILNSDLRDITEYGRAVHGEMDAILSCGRLGIVVAGKYLFVTTFPCHNCTRHIISSGIRRVYYIEPYAKSKARDLHFDAICFSEEDAEKTGKLPFLPFVGIGPRRYLDLFSLELSGGRKLERKDVSGKPQFPRKDESPPRVPMIPFSYLEREDKLLEEFRDSISKLQVKSNGKC
jgi:deoxycytidylate deaminase